MHQPNNPATDLVDRLQKARKIATQDNLMATEKTKAYFDKRAAPHTFQENQKVLVWEYYFLGKNPKLSAQWMGPHTIFV